MTIDRRDVTFASGDSFARADHLVRQPVASAAA